MERNIGMENGMEQRMYTVAANSCNWHCSVQVELLSRAVISPQKLYEQLRHCPPSCFIILAWYRYWFIIRCFVIVVLQSQTLERKTRVWLRKTIILQSSAWTNLNVLDGRNQRLILAQSLPSVHLDPQSLLGLTTAFINSSKCGSYAWYGLVSRDPEF